MSDIVRELLEAELVVLFNLKAFGLITASWWLVFAPGLVGLSLWAIANGAKAIAND